MIRKIRDFIKIFIGVDIATLIGKSLFVWWDYKNNPGFYAMNSAPWYVEIIAYAVVTFGVAAVALAVYLYLGYIIKKRNT